MGKQQRTRIALSLVISGILAGCSGGGGNNNNNGNNPPPGGNTPPPALTGDTYAITSSNRLVNFNATSPNTAVAVNITGLANGENIIAADLRPAGTPAGQMYALTSSARLYTIDPSSGAATLKSTMVADPSDTTQPFATLMGTRVSIDVNNLVDQLRIVTNSGQNLRVMMDTGATFTDTPLTVGGVTPNGISEVGYTNNFAPACRTTVYYIDTSTDRLMTSVNASAGVLTPVGSLMVDASAISGFDISTTTDGTNTAFAALTVGGTTSLYTINLMTGAATVVGAISSLNTGETIVGMARPVPTTPPQQAIGELLALTDNNGLVSFNSAFPPKLCTTGTLSGLQGGDTVIGIDTRPADRTLYALASSGRLYTVDPGTGSAALKATLSAAPGDDNPYTALDAGPITIDVSPAADGLRVISASGTNLRVNLDTGATITDAALTPAGSSITSIGYTNKFAGTANATLYAIDTANDVLQTIGRAPGSPINGNLATVGPLGIGDVQAIAGFEINARNNTALAALQIGAAATSSTLYNIDLTKGTATMVGNIGTTSRVRALAASNVPQATVFGLTEDFRLVSFNAATPGSLINNIPITGLQGGEMILGFDLRPSNQTVYILTNGQRVYTLNTTTGMAMLSGSLMPNTNDPFTRLIGTAFGVDFSPTADAMRVITDAEHNLAIVVDNGTTITATSLTRIQAEQALTSPDVVASAYTQNYAGTTDTTLYNIDIATNRLLTQKPANNGVLTSVGQLTPATTASFTFSGAFDIAGGEDGMAIAALQPNTGGVTQSTLYRVDLRTGTLTAIGPIGTATTQRLMGLTIRLQ